LVIQTSGYIFYIIHGVIIDDYPTIATGGIAMVQGIILVVLCCLYKTVEADAGDAGDSAGDAADNGAVEMVVL